MHDREGKIKQEALGSKEQDSGAGSTASKLWDPGQVISAPEVLLPAQDEYDRTHMMGLRGGGGGEGRGACPAQCSLPTPSLPHLTPPIHLGRSQLNGTAIDMQ